MSEHHPKITPDQIDYLPQISLILDDFEAESPILDLGGGGDGVIGRLKGSQVVAIDPVRAELEEAAAGPLKIVMDARDLKFLDESFSTVTAFFVLLYIAGEDHLQVFKEAFRVLRRGGRFQIWDAQLTPCKDPGKRIVVVPLSLSLPSEALDTGYGVRYPEKLHDLSYYQGLAEKAGFQVVAQSVNQHLFSLELVKP